MMLLMDRVSGESRGKELNGREMMFEMLEML